MSRRAKKWALLLGWLSVLCVILTLVLVRAKRSSVYLRIRPGMARADVHKILGKPRDTVIVDGAPLFFDIWDDQKIGIRYFKDSGVVKDLGVLEPRDLTDRLENLRKYLVSKLTHLLR